jgi:demethylmenaquinone methyltransferase/2-methoxy-6-polyprenyl-1,4-benzoquinol methylase
MPFTDCEFDSITIAFGFRNLTYENPNQQKNLKEILRIIKREGKLVILESAVPSNKFILFFYNLYLHCIIIPLGGLISGDWKAYNYLARSSANYYSVAEIKEILGRYGLEANSIKTFFFSAASLISAIKSR